MKTQEWYEDKLLIVRSLLFRMDYQENYEAVKKAILEVRDALAENASICAEEASSLIIHHMLVSEARRMAIYKQYGILTERANRCKQMQTASSRL